MLNIPAASTQYEYIALRGGLDLVTPQLALKPGYVRDALNWEQSITGGYTRIAGYERFDGRPSPSAASYSTLLANITGSIVANDTITGGTSGATGVVISVEDGIVAYTKASGTFTAGEDLEVSAVVEGTVTSIGGSINRDDWGVTQANLAADVYRADIAAVPGSGPVRGVYYFGGVLYAFRNNAGATALIPHKSSGSGWTAIALNNQISFTLGTAVYAEGSSLTQGGASATVLRVVLETGTWAGGTAAGRLIIGTVTGGPFAAGAAAGGGACTLSGAESAITLAPSGRVEIDVGNYGQGSRMYGADGVNKAWEFDGTVLVPITTGTTPDTPKHVQCHQDHLFLTFGASLQHSAIGFPYDWTVAGGAAEYAMPDTITGLVRMPGDQSGGALGILMASTTQMLYGTSAATFTLVSFDDATGAKSYTQAKVGGQVLMFDTGGVFSLRTSQDYGNFSTNALTHPIRPWTQVRRNLARAALVNREKSQYRVFYSDGFGLYITLGNKGAASMPVYFPDPVYCACQGEAPDGLETSFFGSDNGMVYRLDAGTSFDGAAIDHHMTLVYAAQGNSRVRKRYRAAVLEVNGEGYSQFEMTYELGYGGTEPAQGVAIQTAGINLSSVYWDSFTWDDFTWDGRTLTPTELELHGTAENISLRIAGSSDLYAPFTINSVVLHYTTRRGMRFT